MQLENYISSTCRIASQPREEASLSHVLGTPLNLQYILHAGLSRLDPSNHKSPW
jgi:hypothetical protein